MPSLVIVAIVRPFDLIGVANGELPPGLLVPVGPRGQLHHLAARAWASLCRAATVAGWSLTYTYGGTYRTLADQEWLFRSRYVVGGTEGGCKLWNGAMWCKKLVNGKVPSSAATPGTSNHGLGLAIDMAIDIDPGDGVSPDDAENITPALDWLAEHAPRFGFSWELLPSEPWHIRYVTGDHIPQAVIDWEPHPELPPDPTEEDSRVNAVVGLEENHADPRRWLFNGVSMHLMKSEEEFDWLRLLFPLHPTYNTLVAPLWMTGAEIAEYS